MHAINDLHMSQPVIESVSPDLLPPGTERERSAEDGVGTVPLDTVRSRPAGMQPEPDDDRELLARVARGDRMAFEALYARYRPRLTAFLHRFISSRELIDEVVNDTLFTVWCKAANFRGDSRVSTWIFGIGYRRALRALRSAKRDTPPGTLVPVEMIEAELTSENPAGACEEREWIARGLARLPAAQRIVIELAYMVGLSCQEIATIVDCPVNTVKTRMFKARERLRPVLEHLAGDAVHADARLRRTS